MTTISASMVKELRDKTGQAMMDCKAALNDTGGDMEKAIELLRKKGMAVMDKRSERETKEGRVVSRSSADNKTVALFALCSETDFTAKNEEFIATAEAGAEALLAASAAPTDEATLGALPTPDGSTIADKVNDIISKTGEKTTLGSFARLQLDGDGVVHSYVHFNNKLGAVVQLETDKPVDAETLKPLAGDLAMHATVFNPDALNRDEVDPALVAKEREIAAEQVKGKPENIIEKIVDGKLNKWYGDIVMLEQAFVKDDSKTVQEVIAETAKQLGVQITLAAFKRVAAG